MTDKRPTKLHEEIIAREQLKEPTSKGQLVPFKPQTKASLLAKIGQVAGKVARRNPLIEIIAQLLPGKEQVSKNIEGAKEQAKIAEMTRREFLRRSGGAVANQLAGNPLMKAIVKSVGNIPDAEPKSTLAEIVLNELVKARDDPNRRIEIIDWAIKKFGIDKIDKEPVGPHGITAPDSHILGERLNKELGVVAEDDIFRDRRYPGTDEIFDETHADWNLQQTIDSWGGPEGYMNHINKLEATGELAKPGWGEGTTAEEVRRKMNRVWRPSSKLSKMQGSPAMQQPALDLGQLGTGRVTLEAAENALASERAAPNKLAEDLPNRDVFLDNAQKTLNEKKAQAVGKRFGTQVEDELFNESGHTVFDDEIPF